MQGVKWQCHTTTALRGLDRAKIRCATKPRWLANSKVLSMSAAWWAKGLPELHAAR